MTRILPVLLVVLSAFSCRAPEPSEGATTREGPEQGMARAQPPAKRQPAKQAPQAPQAQAQLDPRMLNPAGANEQAPARFTVEMDTTKGPIIIEVTRAWAPHGADRFYNLVRIGYFTDVAFFRVLDGFMAQGGIHGDPRVNRAWRNANIPDDPAGQHSNSRGMVTYAMGGPNTRTTQFFINYGNNDRLDGMGFAPFGRVRDMAAVDRLYKEYGEGAPNGRGPNQGQVQSQGNTYLRQAFPNLDYIRSARIRGGN